MPTKAEVLSEPGMAPLLERARQVFQVLPRPNARKDVLCGPALLARQHAALFAPWPADADLPEVGAVIWVRSRGNWRTAVVCERHRARVRVVYVSSTGGATLLYVPRKDLVRERSPG